MPAKTIEEELTKIVSAHIKRSVHDDDPFNDKAGAKVEHNQLLSHINRVDLSADEITIAFTESSHLGVAMTLTIRFRKRGVERKLIIGDMESALDDKLIKNLAQAHQWVDELKQGQSPQDIMSKHNLKPGYFRRRLKLATLSPKIQKAIVDGKQPKHITLTYLVRIGQLPTCWKAQEKQLGIHF